MQHSFGNMPRIKAIMVDSTNGLNIQAFFAVINSVHCFTFIRIAYICRYIVYISNPCWLYLYCLDFQFLFAFISSVHSFTFIRIVRFYVRSFYVRMYCLYWVFTLSRLISPRFSIFICSSQYFTLFYHHSNRSIRVCNRL